MVMITGDAMGKPLIEALDEPGASYDLSSLIGFTSTAALFSPAVKDEFFRHFPNLIMTDAIGSSESGNNGITRVMPGATAMKGGPTVTAVGESVVFDDALNLVKPGSGVIGKIARSGNIPIGYYNDPKKTAEVFITVDGKRYVMPGDFATIEADGSVTLLGRGSICINSGARRSSPKRSKLSCGPTPTSWTPSSWVRPTSGSVSVWPPSSSLARDTRLRRWKRSRSTAASMWPATRCPVSSTWSTPSRGRRAGSPTTGGPTPS